ncbi:hypothetical protein, partial [Clavibacter phaseoli]|uniref:hypothetical protein n=1 Tax=Clavibacter phaseoli TaxID=1734031 RepID=UPI000EC7DBB9
VAVAGLWFTRRGRAITRPWMWKVAIWAAARRGADRRPSTGGSAGGMRSARTFEARADLRT